MTQRGVKKPGSRMVTSATRGTFRSHDVTRGEFLALSNGGPVSDRLAELDTDLGVGEPSHFGVGCCQHRHHDTASDAHGDKVRFDLVVGFPFGFDRFDTAGHRFLRNELPLSPGRNAEFVVRYEPVGAHQFGQNPIGHGTMDADIGAGSNEAPDAAGEYERA
ncbi:hypothetical protein HC762_01500 [bacterium]|nr:hypothetical protein [bacterium]